MEDFKNTKEGRAVAQKYSDILHLSRPEPPVKHPRMALSNRAKIFSPFAALRGFDDEISSEGASKLLVKKEERSKVTSELQLEETLKAPVTQGQEVGKLVVSVDGKERMSIPVVTQTQVPRLTFSGMFGSLWRRMATGN